MVNITDVSQSWCFFFTKTGGDSNSVDVFLHNMDGLNLLNTEPSYDINNQILHQENGFAVQNQNKPDIKWIK